MSNTPTPCNECGKTHPWLSCVTPATATGLTTPTELPEDIKKEINETSEAYANKRYKFSHYPNEWMAVNNAHHAGATAYAPHKVEAERAKKLLQKFISRHEAGLLPDRFIYDEINQFLNGK